MAKPSIKFINKPVYPGGAKALQSFLKEELRYPEAAKAAGVSGKVQVEYSLNHKGRVVRAKAVKGPEHGCREEAVRLVKMLRFDIPQGYKINLQFHQHIYINFELPQPITAPSTSIQYSIKASAKNLETQVDKKQGGVQLSGKVTYTYTIPIK